jgi:GTP cyclohydrolase I
MKMLNLDLSDDSLKNTPERVAKMFVNETMSGLDYNDFPKCTTVNNKMQYDEMVTVKDITVHSVCEHHWAQIDGYATIAYIPNDKILGLSKFPRIVDFFSRRPQIQERLTEQIFYSLQHILETDNIAVAINADHYCVKSRGIRDQNSSTITSKLGGVFKENPSAKAEFMAFFNSK